MPGGLQTLGHQTSGDLPGGGLAFRRRDLADVHDALLQQQLGDVDAPIRTGGAAGRTPVRRTIKAREPSPGFGEYRHPRIKADSPIADLTQRRRLSTIPVFIRLSHPDAAGLDTENTSNWKTANESWNRGCGGVRLVAALPTAAGKRATAPAPTAPPGTGNRLANNARTINLGQIDMRRQRGQQARAGDGFWE